MKTLLFPRWCRAIGLILFPIFYLGFHFEITFDFLSTLKSPEDTGDMFSNNNMTDEIALGGMLLTLFMIGFSKLKIEDELVSYLRLRSLNLSMYINYFLLMIVIFTVTSFEFLFFLAYDVYVLPLLYIIIFNIQLHILPRFKKDMA